MIVVSFAKKKYGCCVPLKGDMSEPAVFFFFFSISVGLEKDGDQCVHTSMKKNFTATKAIEGGGLVLAGWDHWPR
jgi:hypothetical protein